MTTTRLRLRRFLACALSVTLAVAGLGVATPARAIDQGADSASLDGQVQFYVTDSGTLGRPDDFQCGGTLIDVSWVLFAKHCITETGATVDNSGFLIGSRTAGQGTPHTPERFFLEPNTDTALVQLEDPFSNPSAVEPIGRTVPPVNAEVAIRGWGSATTPMKERLQVGTLRVRDTNDPDGEDGARLSMEDIGQGVPVGGDSGSGVKYGREVTAVTTATDDDLGVAYAVPITDIAPWIRQTSGVNPTEAGSAPPPQNVAPPSADPSVIRVGNTFYSVDSAGGGIYLRSASTANGVRTAAGSLIWTNPEGLREVWAPEIVYLDRRFYIYFSAGAGAAHRMYVISSAEPGRGYGAAQKVNLPDDKWAIDGTTFTFGNQLWFVWSGWEGNTDGEQSLFLARMSNPVTPTGPRHIISQPRESWERGNGGPFINEGPQPIKDPDGQLHIVYSANHSWEDQYCLGDLRLRKGGDPTYVWDWYKSNGCLFGSSRNAMMREWDPTLNVNGPGHHSFVLENGDINASPPPAGRNFDFMFHAVAKGTPYSWENRRWFFGGAGWRSGCTYSRQNVPGANTNVGWSLKFFEDRNFGGDAGGAACTTSGGATVPGRLDFRHADPSVMRVGGTYHAAYVNADQMMITSAGSPEALNEREAVDVGGCVVVIAGGLVQRVTELWAPELTKIDGRYYLYASGVRDGKRRMYVRSSSSPTSGWGVCQEMDLPDGKWAVDGTAFRFGSDLWFVWSGWEGDTNVEQNLYIAKMSSPERTTGGRHIISQPREPWERVVGNPFINEAPAPLKDPSGQLHIFYSANGSWGDQYCVADLRLRAGGDPTYVWDWYKSNGCLFGSNRATMMAGWDPTLFVDGPGSSSFVLLDGDINTSPPAGQNFPLAYHAVAKGTQYTWANREWFVGGFGWRSGCTFGRQNVPGANTNVGWSLKFFEDRDFGNNGGGGAC